MNVQHGDRWEDFETWIASVDAERVRRKQSSQLHVSGLLYRGHSDSEWSLQTVLERYAPNFLDASEYFRAIHAVKPQIESHTGQHWPILTPPEYDAWLEKEIAFALFDLPAYEYMVHLRHHGFPSPLLDWSQSPYVAAFFAFNHAKPSGGRVAIYAYLEYAGKAKSSSGPEPAVHVRGPYVRSHRRHFLQQSEYTVCTQRVNNRWQYASHDAAFAAGADDQDLLWKFTLPSSERLRALRHLDRFNLNAFSLFGSEESLMETVALRTFHFSRDELYPSIERSSSMPVADYTNYRFPVPEAARLASLGGIEQDLRGVIAYCDLLIERSEIAKLNFVEWEAISSAALVRYARCFSFGVRDSLTHGLLDTADAALKEAHRFFVELRSKHVAHSINPFEENDVTLQIAAHFQSSQEIFAVNTSHGRLIGLSFGAPDQLKRLAEWVLLKVEEEMKTEKAKLLQMARERPLAELKAYGVPQAAASASDSQVGQRRKRP